MSRETIMPLAVDDIEILGGRREVDPATVKRLADSIESIGLRHPITVRRKGEQYILVAGRHRIEAFKKLEREHIPASIVVMTNAEARMWEIAENLHRAELSKLERAEQIEEWRQLAAQLGQQSHNSKGVSAASEQLGVTRQEVQRATQIASITPEAKNAAHEAGMDNNQSKLLAVSREAPDRQVAKVVELAAHPLNDFETKEKWLATGMSWWNRGSKEWREEFLSRVDSPLMDRQYGTASK